MSGRPEDRYPLTWPDGWKRTSTYQRASSPFRNTSNDKAYRELIDELQRLGARDVLVSSNLKLRQDGAPYATQPRHDDEGIAVYFTRKGKAMVLACDKFLRRADNMRAIAKTIDAIRGIERWGSSDMMERAFTGFAQLEHAPTVGRSWWEVLEVSANAGSPAVAQAYRRRRSATHPDNGGDPTEFNAVQDAYTQFTKERQL